MRAYSLYMPINHNLMFEETNEKRRSCYGSSLTRHIVLYSALLSVELSSSLFSKPSNAYQTGISAVTLISSSCLFPFLSALL